MAPRRKSPRFTAAEKAKNIEVIPEDYLTSLPEDILVSILSRLPLKEAGRTSVLSRQWEYLWTYVSRLEFEANAALDAIASCPITKLVERPRYIHWVNSVVRKHRGTALDTFKASFDLDSSSQAVIDSWVRFAIGKKVQNLELEFLDNGERLRRAEHCYTIPFELLTWKGASFWNIGSFAYQIRLSLLTGLKSLETLSLRSVNVSDEGVHSLLACCPNLKSVAIHGSGFLRNVRISGFNLRLMHFETIRCPGLESIVISNVNLVTFVYLGPGIKIIVSNVPMLNQISVGVGYSGRINNVFQQFACCLYQLVNVTLDIHLPQEDMTVYNFPGLPNLKQLVLKLGAWEDHCLLEYTAFIQGCPLLTRLVIQLIWIAPMRRRRKLRVAPGSPHESLKQLEIMGYFGRLSEVELVRYCIQHCVALKRIIVVPRNQIRVRALFPSENCRNEKVARQCAIRQLEPIIPSGVELTIL